jgi:hypothetical protein
LYANETGDDCPRSFATRAEQVSKTLNAYIQDSANAGAFGWAWQPGGQPNVCELGNLDADTTSQAHFRTTSK